MLLRNKGNQGQAVLANHDKNPPLTPRKLGNLPRPPRNPMHPNARRLRVIMADLYLSVDTVAEMLGQTTSKVSRWRHGAPPPPEWMLRLLKHELAARGMTGPDDAERPSRRAA